MKELFDALRMLLHGYCAQLVSDGVLHLSWSDLTPENVAEQLRERGVSEEDLNRFLSIARLLEV